MTGERFEESPLLRQLSDEYSKRETARPQRLLSKCGKVGNLVDRRGKHSFLSKKRKKNGRRSVQSVLSLRAARGSHLLHRTMIACGDMWNMILGLHLEGGSGSLTRTTFRPGSRTATVVTSIAVVRCQCGTMALWGFLRNDLLFATASEVPIPESCPSGSQFADSKRSCRPNRKNNQIVARSNEVALDLLDLSLSLSLSIKVDGRY